MSIKAVFRVQCDGPCKGWLSRTENYVLGTDINPEHNEVLLTAERAWLWSGERAARIAAQDAGWSYMTMRYTGDRLMCPKCRENPLGVQLPPDRGQVAALIRTQAGSLPVPKPCKECTHIHQGRYICGHTMTGYPCICMNSEDDR